MYSGSRAWTRCARPPQSTQTMIVAIVTFHLGSSPTPRTRGHRPSRYAAAMPLPEPLRELSARVSNWGRWGADDERGTLNLVTTDAGAPRARRGPHRSGVLARDPVRRRRPAVGQRQHAVAHEPDAQHLRRQRELHRRHRPISPRATTPSRWDRRPRPTGTRSPTSVTRARSTTASTNVGRHRRRRRREARRARTSARS